MNKKEIQEIRNDVKTHLMKELGYTEEDLQDCESIMVGVDKALNLADTHHNKVVEGIKKHHKEDQAGWLVGDSNKLLREKNEEISLLNTQIRELRKQLDKLTKDNTSWKFNYKALESELGSARIDSCVLERHRKNNRVSKRKQRLNPEFREKERAYDRARERNL